MTLPPLVAIRMRSTQSHPLPSGRQMSIRATSGDAARTRSSAPCTESAVSTSAPQLTSQSETASAQLSLSSTTSTRRPERSSRPVAARTSAIRVLFAGWLDPCNPSWRDAHGKKAGDIARQPTPRALRLSKQRRRPRRRSLVGRGWRRRYRGVELGIEIEDVPRVRPEVALAHLGFRANREHGSVGRGLRLHADADVVLEPPQRCRHHRVERAVRRVLLEDAPVRALADRLLHRAEELRRADV